MKNAISLRVLTRSEDLAYAREHFRPEAIERPFCAFDREYFGRPVSRDAYAEDVRRRYF